MAQEYGRALAAGVVPAWLELPGGIRGRQRIVRIAKEGISHIATRHPDWLVFCLNHMGEVLAKPEYLGHRPRTHAQRVEFVRRVGSERELTLVAVKFLDERDESWVTTAHRLKLDYLTRRLRAGTMQVVSRGP